MQRNPRKLDYQSPWPNEPAKATGPKNTDDRALNIVFGSILLFIAAVVLLAIPFPFGTWYFGHKPQWVISFEPNNIMVGPWPDVVNLGLVGVIILRLLIIGIPIWIVKRIWFRRPKVSQPSATCGVMPSLDNESKGPSRIKRLHDKTWFWWTVIAAMLLALAIVLLPCL